MEKRRKTANHGPAAAAAATAALKKLIGYVAHSTANFLFVLLLKS